MSRVRRVVPTGRLLLSFLAALVILQAAACSPRSPVGRRVYVSTGRGQTVVVFDSQTFEVVAEVPVGQRAWGLAVTPDGRKVYVACGGSDASRPGSNEVTVIDAATNTVSGSIKAGDGPWGVAIAGS